MDWFKIVKGNYVSGYYTADDVKVFVAKGKITPEQYLQITGQEYVA